MIEYKRHSYKVQYNSDLQEVMIYTHGNQLVYCFSPDSQINTLEEEDICKDIKCISYSEEGFRFKVQSSLWESKDIEILLNDDAIEYKIHVSVAPSETKSEFIKYEINTINYLKNSNRKTSSEISRIYVPRFDWREGKVLIKPTESDSLSCQQWLSPPPFCYGLIMEDQVVGCGIGAYPGAYNFMSFDYIGGVNSPSYQLTYEGHTSVVDSFSAPSLIFIFGEVEENNAIDKYIKYLRKKQYLPELIEKVIPKWWKEPIFCGWGEMRYDYRRDHDNNENGTFINVTSYANEASYRYYDTIMEKNGVNPGTIIIDMGWADEPALAKPCLRRFINLRKFIDEQHDKGRKVLLWYTPVVTLGLPDNACLTLKGNKIAPDPSNPLYQKILSEELHMMLSDEEHCLNCDGFKIDFTQNTPSENGIYRNYLTSFWGLIQEDKGDNNPYVYPKLIDRVEKIKTYGDIWGVELLHKYIELIYNGMKKVKPDSVLITHTANPYFADIVDVLRLNDLDGDNDNVLEIMENRYAISKMCNPNWLIDTDNDLMYDKQRWREYIQLQPKLGIPDTYYISGIATSMEKFDITDYDLLNKVWENYRKTI